MQLTIVALSQAYKFLNFAVIFIKLTKKLPVKVVD